MCTGVAPQTSARYVGQLAGLAEKKPAVCFLSDSSAQVLPTGGELIPIN